jgi:peptide/nickel transport system ATP-binding protein
MENGSSAAVQTPQAQLVNVRGLVKHFPVEGSDDVVRAVDGVSFAILRGETLGLVGESGCGSLPWAAVSCV